MDNTNAVEPVKNDEDVVVPVEDRQRWLVMFWYKHGERLIFAALALALAGALYYFNQQAEAKTILVGIAMLFFNKVRSGNGGATTK